MAGDALGGEAHGEQRGRIVLGEPGIGAGLVAAHGNQAHGFCAAGDDDAAGAGANAHVGLRNGFETGGAEAVDGGAGNFDGKPGAQSGHARDVEALLAFGLSAAEDHVVDFGFVELRELGPKRRSMRLRRDRRGGWWRARLWGRGQRECARR